MIRSIRNTLLTATILALITTNILTLLYQPFATAISTALASAFGIATVTSMLSDAIDLKDIEIDKQKKANTRMKRQVVAKDKALQKYHAQASQRKLAVKNIGNRLLQRTQRLALKTIAAIPGKAIPVIGAGAILGGTAYEIYVACQNLKDIQQMQQECGVDESAEKSIMEDVCQVSEKIF